MAEAPESVPAVPRRQSSTKSVLVRVLWDYHPSEPDELHLSEGQIVQAKESEDEQWWFGTANGKSGYFPKNYTERVQTQRPPAPTRRPSPSPPSANVNLNPSTSIATPAATQQPQPSRVSYPAHHNASVAGASAAQVSSGPARSSSIPSGSGPADDRGRHVKLQGVVWKHPSFVGMCSDRFIQGSWPSSVSQEMSAMRKSLQLLMVGVDRAKAPSSALRLAKGALERGLWVCESLPVQLEGAAVDIQAFYNFLANFTQMVGRLEENQCAIIPGGWWTSTEPDELAGSDDSDSESEIAEQKAGTQAEEKEKTGSGRAGGGTAGQSHVVVYVLVRKGDSFSFVVCNTGHPKQGPTSEPRWDGLDFHPSQLDVGSGKVKFNVGMSVVGIPRYKLLDSSFWFMLLKCKIYPNPKHTAHFIYATLLPYLNSQPLYANESSFLLKSMDMRSIRGTTDGSMFHLLKQSLRAALLLSGVPKSQVADETLQVRVGICEQTKVDLLRVKSLQEHEATLIKIATKQLANAAGRRAYAEGSSSSPDTLQQVAGLINEVDELVSRHMEQSTASRLPPQIASDARLTGGARVGQSGAEFPLFSCFKRDFDVEGLAGASRLRPILRPIVLSLVPEEVGDFNDVANALRHALRLCTLLENQREQIRNSACLRVVLLHHLFLNVIPLPLPYTHPLRQSNCFWQSQPMRYETQADILRLLEGTCRHFGAAAFSLDVSRSFDALRVITMACIATITDAVLRVQASDIPSLFSLHYDGKAAGPVAPFGFEINDFIAESGFLVFYDPNMVLARTQVLDYFHSIQQVVGEEHRIFRFERSMLFGDAEAVLIEQLCLAVGFNRNPECLPLYLTGQLSALIDTMPELAFFRDIIFLFKAMLSPKAETLPDTRQWNAVEARLTWRVDKPAKDPSREPANSASNANSKAKDKHKAKLAVAGFGQPSLKCAAYAPVYSDADVVPRKSALDAFIRAFGFGHADRPRAPPSAANPSVLAGQAISTEDDVLHIRHLPDFGGRLRARDAELLLQYLTAPYLRVPLVLQFFAEPTRIAALANEELQSVLDACLFEPGVWRDPTNNGIPSTVPAPNRKHLATPVGLLLNELLRSPKVVLDAFEQILFQALELDCGRFNDTSSMVILYVVRMMVRVERFLLVVIDHHEHAAQRKTSSVGARAYVRGLAVDSCAAARASQERLRHQLLNKVHGTLERWRMRAAKERRVHDLCTIYAHMAYAFSNVTRDTYDYRIVLTLLVSYVFINVNYSFQLEKSGDRQAGRKKSASASAGKGKSDRPRSSLGIEPTEVFSVYQKHRNSLLQWLRAHPSECDELMEQIIRQVTMIEHQQQQHQARHWREPDIMGGVGRFLPDTEAANLQQTQAALEEIHAYEAWLRQSTTQAVDTEINIQLGEFTLKKNTMQQLSQEIVQHSVFRDVFGSVDTSNGSAIQCAEVHDTEFRTWKRLLGQRHDVQLWTPDTRTQMALPPAFSRAYPGSLKGDEEWVKNVLEPWRMHYFKQVDLFASTASASAQPFAVLAGLLKEEGASTLVEVVVFRQPPTVHFYQMIEYGRRYYRTLVFTSNASYCYRGDFGSAVPTLSWSGAGITLSVGHVPKSPLGPAQSLVIYRNIDAATGLQQYLPKHLINGLLPEALLEQYQFWQNVDSQRIVGHADDRENLIIEISAHSAAQARVTRGSLTLLNVLYAARNTALQAFYDVLRRLDDLSHLLIWSKDRSMEVDLVELPRVCLSFRMERESGRLLCQEHAGLFVSSHRCAVSTRLIKGLPHAVVLENVQGELFVLLAAIALPSRPQRPGVLFSPEILLDRTDAEWNARLGDVRHFLYSIHISKAFMFSPTLASTLYLLLMRLLAREYQLAFRLIDSCVWDGQLTDEEKQIFGLLAKYDSDADPNAHACRLKLLYVTLGCDDMSCSWSVAQEMAQYILKHPAVDAACRLSIKEELFLLHHIQAFAQTGNILYASAQHGPVLQNRLSLLQAMTGSVPANAKVRIVHVGRPDVRWFDAVKDETVLEDRKTASSWRKTLKGFANLKSIKYARPAQEMVGTEALLLFDRVSRKGLSVHGKKSSLGFIFLYEMMTGTLPVRILPNDSSYNWACVLLRLFSPKKFEKTQTMMSILRILANNPDLVKAVPKYEDDRKHKVSVMFRGQQVVKKLLEKCNSVMQKHAASIQWPAKMPMPWNPGTHISAPLTVPPQSLRRWLAPRNTEFSLRSREYAPIELAALSGIAVGHDRIEASHFAGLPLGTFVDKYVTTSTSNQALSGETRLDVQQHVAARSAMARAMVDRMKMDAQFFAQQENKRQVHALDTSQTASLISELQDAVRADAATVAAAISACVDLANWVDTSQEASFPSSELKQRLGFLLFQYGGSEVTVWFEFLCTSHMAREGDATLMRLNPFLSGDTLRDLRNLCAGIMLRCNRMAQALRAIEAAHALAEELEAAHISAGPPADLGSRSREILLKADAVCKELTTQRWYVRVGGGAYAYDPRFLVFEFTHSLVLRESQVTLVNDFIARVARGESRCHQMIMGAGKTTVVGPLLVLALAQGEGLLMQVVPRALLEFSRSVMRDKFSALIQKPVYTFYFDRLSKIDKAVYQKLCIARDTMGVVCTTPTALKSFFLSFVQAAHALDASRFAEKDAREAAPTTFTKFLKEVLFREEIAGAKIKVLAEEDRLLLQKQVQVSADIIERLLRPGTLIMDEVDLILHPLKSELNWPIGVKIPLDFTKSRNKGSHGVRWMIPAHFLDAFFYGHSESSIPLELRESAKAQTILKRIRSIIDKGVELKLIQLTPHLVLLSKFYYTAKLKPLLAMWMLLFLTAQGLRGMSDPMIMNYLIKEKTAQAVANLSDDNVKMLNLSHEWLNSLGPFVLSKIDRVRFGLLHEADISRAESTGIRMPKSRKLLAVPFVGKDSPSLASEFSHPDVVIGLTILAYRYEGKQQIGPAGIIGFQISYMFCT